MNVLAQFTRTARNVLHFSFVALENTFSEALLLFALMLLCVINIVNGVTLRVLCIDVIMSELLVYIE